jgi:hypothetical protein
VLVGASEAICPQPAIPMDITTTSKNKSNFLVFICTIVNRF